MIYFLIVSSTFFAFGYMLGTSKPYTSRPWYSPSGMAASIIRQIAEKIPPGNDMDMILGAAYGVLEVCGIKRAVKPLFRAFLMKIRGQK